MVANITRTIEEMKEEAEHRGMKKGIEQGIALELIQNLRAKEVVEK